MKTTRNSPLDFEIDKLTNSIENTSTGEVFDTVVVQLTSKDLGFIRKSDWQFDWSKELHDKTKEVFKLTTVNNPKIIQGLISIEDKGYQGFLAFDAKTALIKHYQETLHATHFRGLRMFIETTAALRLISQYFNS
jgi:hypothetical protein